MCPQPQAADVSAEGPQPRRNAMRIDRRRSAAVQVYEDLKERIVSLELAPNTNLSRVALAQEYDVSQTPVREALLRLERDGLVDIFPQSRTVVSRIDVAHLIESHFLRTSVEIEIARRLARTVDKIDLRPARKALARLRIVADDPQGHDEFSVLDRSFHEALFHAAGLGSLHQLIRERSVHLDRLRRLHLPSAGKIAAILDDHEAILQAIASGDENVAADTVRTHLSGTLGMLDTLRQTYPDFFAG